MADIWANHHEITLHSAANLAVPELASLLNQIDDLRKQRNALEYGWGSSVSEDHAAKVVATVSRIVELTREDLAACRPTLAARLHSAG